ncbi:MAG: hypothetical protein LBL07_00165 [Tannerella sp.]|jgi:hypothetical protein|nr:hypothetical protein [Tannerella sp.]
MKKRAVFILMSSIIFVSASDEFRNAPDESRTQRKAWSGADFPMDHALH